MYQIKPNWQLLQRKNVTLQNKMSREHGAKKIF
jgi:hypothetical protein